MIASPSPVLACSPVEDDSPCVKGLNRRFSSAGAMPGPVSSTTKRTSTAPAADAFALHRTVMLPRAVNFSALMR